MCDFVSWIEKEGIIYYATDEEIWKYLRKNGINKSQFYNYCGHFGLRQLFPELYYYFYQEKEGLKQIPKCIAKDIKAGKMKKIMEVAGVVSVTFDKDGRLHSFRGKPALVTDTLYRPSHPPCCLYSKINKTWHKQYHKFYFNHGKVVRKEF